MKSRIEAGNLAKVRKSSGNGTNDGDLRREMFWIVGGDFLQIVQYSVVNEAVFTIMIATVNDTMPDTAQGREACSRLQNFEQRIDAGFVIGCFNRMLLGGLLGMIGKF